MSTSVEKTATNESPLPQSEAEAVVKRETGSPDWESRCRIAESLTNASIDGLVAMDRDLRITSWNDTASLWSGKERADVMGRAFFDVFPNAARTAGLDEALQNALRGRKVFLPAAEGFYLAGHFEAHFVPLRDEAGESTGVLQILHDVSHRIKAENELKALNAQLSQQYTQLQRANAELANFARIASHDLKEPLRKIYTFTELILVHEAGKLSNSGRSNFRRIQTSVQRMGLLTDDIVNFAEISAHTGSATRVDLSEIIYDVIEPFGAAVAQSEALFIIEPLPKVQGYSAALLQMFRQIAGNALKFRGEEIPPRIYIGCTLMPGAEIDMAEARTDQTYHQIRFMDNGIGFDPEYADRIFGMFQRLHPEGQFKGSGMGLPIARKIAQMHGGFLCADSVPGKGSTFYCYLPASAAA